MNLLRRLLLLLPLIILLFGKLLFLLVLLVLCWLLEEDLKARQEDLALQTEELHRHRQDLQTLQALVVAASNSCFFSLVSPCLLLVFSFAFPLLFPTCFSSFASSNLLCLPCFSFASSLLVVVVIADENKSGTNVRRS